MIRCRLLSSAALIALAMPALAAAQSSDTQEPTESSIRDEILVVAERLPGQVDTDLAPVLELNEDDIAAYGAGSIADLVAAIEPQTSSNRGRGGGPPVFLINGVRIGSFREFRSYPPEAIQKIEVLPEEVAQKFGFAPDRRVVNFILKDNYSAITVEVEYEQPDRGGYSFNEQEATLLKITKGGRLNVNLERGDRSALTESERDIIQTPGSIPGVAGDPDPAEFRTLIADSEQYEASVNYAKAFLESGSSLSINGSYEREDFVSLSGLDSVVLTDSSGNSVLRTLNPDDPLARRSVTDTFSTAGSYDRPIGAFRLTGTFDGTLADNQTQIERRADLSQLVADAAAGTLAIDGPLPTIADAGFDTAESKTYLLDSKLTLTGSPIFLPAGEVSTTLDVGYVWNRIESVDSRANSNVDLSRSNISAGVNVSVPITSTREGFLDAVGSISLNGQFGVNEISDFGTLLRWSAGVNWAPFDGLDLQATYTWREVQPSLSQLGNPEITFLNVPTFDFTNNTTELVTVTTGGNPNLLAETQSDWSFSANWRLPFLDGARVQANYSTNRSDNVSSSFPFLTPEIEAAFSDRITRDMAGTLTAIDLRPVDFFETRSKRVSFGFSYNGSIGKAPERGGPPEGSDGGSGGGSGGGAGGPTRQSQPAQPAGESAGAPAAQGAENAEQRRGPAGSGPGAGGPPSDERRAQFAALREKVCADDGEAFVQRLIAAVDKGETFDELPGFDPEAAGRMLARFRNEDGTINTERLAGFRTMMCSGDGPPAGRPGASGPPGSGPPAQASGGRGSGGAAARFFGGGGGDTRARFFLNLNHTVELEREILIAPTGPLLDLLDGDTLTSGGTPQNTSRLEAGIFKGGMGLRLSGQYTGSARINGTGGPGSTDLFIDELARFDLRLFADLGQIFKKEEGPLKNLRLSFRVDNVFDGRRLVTDSNGDTPIGFQPLLIDPTGRYVGVDIRKLF